MKEHEARRGLMSYSGINYTGRVKALAYRQLSLNYTGEVSVACETLINALAAIVKTCLKTQPNLEQAHD